MTGGWVLSPIRGIWAMGCVWGTIIKGGGELLGEPSDSKVDTSLGGLSRVHVLSREMVWGEGASVIGVLYSYG